ncbi:hypothetical protein SLU01_33920 [Sporosarcina luteola]|uniref:Uncharacterized protein n=1 Tax=Sporosarcina luteola TaxID=582850 RepID=A0A511ZCB0_9BACL|nr:hypothetical protein SLU01_33920 [Sporosarcina luteola]
MPAERVRLEQKSTGLHSSCGWQLTRPLRFCYHLAAGGSCSGHKSALLHGKGRAVLQIRLMPVTANPPPSAFAII